MCRSMVDIQSPTAQIRRGKKRKRKPETTGQKYTYFILFVFYALLHMATIITENCLISHSLLTFHVSTVQLFMSVCLHHESKKEQAATLLPVTFHQMLTHCSFASALFHCSCLSMSSYAK